MDKIIILILLTIIGLAFGIILTKEKTKFNKINIDYLYLKKQPQTYIDRLNTKKAKFLFGNITRKFMILDGYINLKDNNQTISLFDELRNNKLSYGKRINLYQKEISYYLEAKMFDKALASYQDLKNEGSLINDPRMLQILSESEALIEVYVKKNIEYIDVLIQLINSSKDDLTNVINNYRIAYCYFNNNNVDKAKEYIKKSFNFSEKTMLNSLLKKVNKDIKLINEYII